MGGGEGVKTCLAWVFFTPPPLRGTPSPEGEAYRDERTQYGCRTDTALAVQTIGLERGIRVLDSLGFAPASLCASPSREGGRGE